MKNRRITNTQNPNRTDTQPHRSIPGHYLTAVLILGLAATLCWQLPPIIMEWQDKKQVGKSHVQHASPVIATTRERMTLMEKINLICNDTSTTLDIITSGKQYPTESDALSQVKTELKQLQETGILKTYGTLPQTTGTADVLFTIDMDDSERSGLFWRGMVSNETWEFHWCMDDETGKLLSVIQLRHSGTDIWDTNTRTNSFAVDISDNDAAIKWQHWADEDELTTYITKWSEYLGCTVQETGKAEQYGFPGNDWKFITKSLQNECNGTATDIYYEAGKIMGYSVEFLYHLHYAILTDGSQSIVYYFIITENERFFWCLNEIH